MHVVFAVRPASHCFYTVMCSDGPQAKDNETTVTLFWRLGAHLDSVMAFT